jgi:hypothetical protein
MFPGANARVDYNEAGEPLGWDYPADDAPDPSDYLTLDDVHAETLQDLFDDLKKHNPKETDETIRQWARDDLNEWLDASEGYMQYD